MEPPRYTAVYGIMAGRDMLACFIVYDAFITVSIWITASEGSSRIFSRATVSSTFARAAICIRTASFFWNTIFSTFNAL